MLCALTVRQLKPGTFERFADENRVVTFGFFDGTLEELERSQAESGYEDRRAAVDDLVGDVVVNGVFEVVREMSVA